MGRDQTASKQGGGTRRILIVGRRADDLERLRRYLNEKSYELIEAGSSDEALEHVSQDKVDLLVLDSSDKEIDCFGLCQRLHTKPETAAIPIIAISDPKNVEDGMTALTVGADDFITRPFIRAGLLVRVRMLLRIKELHDGLLARNAQLRSVNAELGRLNRELAHRNRELEQGMEMARRLQEALLPQSYPRVKNISFCHLYMPSDIVGGDLFQIAGMSGGRAAIFVSDVSGHGIRAGLITSIVKTVFEHVYLEDKDPAQVLRDMNSRFRNVLGPLNPYMFATGFILMVNGPERTVSLASAGHPSPFLIRKDDMSCRAMMEMGQIGPALGFFPDPNYPTVECSLAPGDIALGFTDGIYEVLSEKGEMFGLERMLELLRKNTHMIPRDLIQKIVAETDEFRGGSERSDDVCLVAVEVH